MRTSIALVAACLAFAPALPAHAQTPTLPSLAGTADPVVTVLSTGAAPRRVLRYTATPGAKERLELTMRMSLAMMMGETAMPAMDMPPMTMSMDMDITDINAAGDIALKMAFVHMAMENTPLPPGVAEALKNMSGSMTLSNRGVLKTMDFNTAGLDDPGVKQLLSTAGFDKLSTPLPEEPLGVGARWEVTQGIAINGMNTTQKSTFEVVSMDATSATMKVSMTQMAGAQKAELPGLPPGADVQLLSLEGGGTGTLTLTPGSLVLHGEMDVVSKIVMDVNAEGQNQRMSTSTTMKMTLAKGKR